MTEYIHCDECDHRIINGVRTVTVILPSTRDNRIHFCNWECVALYSKAKDEQWEKDFAAGQQRWDDIEATT